MIDLSALLIQVYIHKYLLYIVTGFVYASYLTDSEEKKLQQIIQISYTWIKIGLC